MKPPHPVHPRRVHARRRWRPWLAYFTRRRLSTAWRRRCRRTIRRTGGARASLTFADYVDGDGRGARDASTRPPVVIGHSMGGLIAQHRRGEQPSAPALVLVSSTPPWRTGTTRHARALRCSTISSRSLAGRPLRGNPKAARKLVLHDLSPAEQRRPPRRSSPTSPARPTARWSSAARRSREGAVRCPVLCRQRRRRPAAQAGRSASGWPRSITPST